MSNCREEHLPNVLNVKVKLVTSHRCLTAHLKYNVCSSVGYEQTPAAGGGGVGWGVDYLQLVLNCEISVVMHICTSGLR